MRLAREISLWSKDPSTKVGAIIVNRNHRIIATGYNGFPSRIEDDPKLLEDRTTKYRLIIHAEMNALLNALNNGISVEHCSLYVYPLPTCGECAKNIVQSGVDKVFMISDDLHNERWRETWLSGRDIFDRGRIELSFIPKKDLDDVSLTIPL